MERIHNCDGAKDIHWDEFDLSVDLNSLLKNIELSRLINAAREGFPALVSFFTKELHKRDKIEPLSHITNYMRGFYEMKSTQFAKEVEEVLKETGYL